MRHHRYIYICILLAVFLAACTGGGGGGSAPAPTQQPANNTVPTTQNPIANNSSNKIPPPNLPSTDAYRLDAETRSLAFAVDEEDRRSDVLVYCTVMIRGNDACSFNDLPLIGMETDNPTVDDIMSRAVVTHPWMATRLQDLLEIMPPEVLLMMRGATAIVVSSGINVSYYTAQTGAMYLSAEGMWLTQAEEAVLTDEPDERIASQRRFKWLMLWRYVEGDTDIRSFSRSLTSLKRSTTALLFHELAHANDYYPIHAADQFVRAGPIWYNINPDVITSEHLASTYPLQSEYMFDFAAVGFGGGPATQAQLDSVAEDIVGEFSNDHANDYYNYYTNREDLAMAFEEAMLMYTLNLHRDVAVVSVPEIAENCGDYLVAWGQRGRIGDPAVAARSLYAVQRLLPEAASGVAAMLDEMPIPAQMQEGVDWCTNITLGAPSQLSLINPAELPVEGNVEILPPWR
jgi:hypothetical protein